MMLRLKRDSEVLSLIGEAIAAERIRRRTRQEDLAERAGVGRRALQGLEGGKIVRTDTLIRVLRALQMLDRLSGLIEPSLTPVVSPLDEDEAQSLPQRVRIAKGPGM